MGKRSLYYIEIGVIIFIALSQVNFKLISLGNLFITCLFFIFLPLLFDLYILNYIFWQVRGYEVVEITEKTLSIKKKGKIFKDNFIIPLYKIKDIREQEYKAIEFGTSIWIKPWEFSDVIGEEEKLK